MVRRKIELPVNYLDQDSETMDAMEEDCYMWGLKVSHGHGPDSPLLKSNRKVEREVRRLQHGP